MTKNNTDVAVIGAGPAGMSAAFVLSENHKDIVVLEMSDQVGGISRTIERDGFRFDIGGHRFFTKDEEVDQFFKDILGEEAIWVQRSSKIYYLGKYFDYPLKPANAIFGMGVGTIARCLADYGYVKVETYSASPRSFPWRTGSAMNSAANSSSGSSRIIPRRSGASIAARSKPSGRRSESRDCR